jgi:hypothetical protein
MSGLKSTRIHQNSQQFQKINARCCRVSESDWNYWPPLVVYLIVNVWNLKMYTAIDIERRARHPTPHKYFKEK